MAKRFLTPGPLVVLCFVALCLEMNGGRLAIGDETRTDNRQPRLISMGDYVVWADKAIDPHLKPEECKEIDKIVGKIQESIDAAKKQFENAKAEYAKAEEEFKKEYDALLARNGLRRDETGRVFLPDGTQVRDPLTTGGRIIRYHDNRDCGPIFDEDDAGNIIPFDHFLDRHFSKEPLLDKKGKQLKDPETGTPLVKSKLINARSIFRSRSKKFRQFLDQTAGKINGLLKRFFGTVKKRVPKMIPKKDPWTGKTILDKFGEPLMEQEWIDGKPATKMVVVPAIMWNPEKGFFRAADEVPVLIDLLSGFVGVWKEYEAIQHDPQTGEPVLVPAKDADGKPVMVPKKVTKVIWISFCPDPAQDGTPGSAVLIPRFDLEEYEKDPKTGKAHMVGFERSFMIASHVPGLALMDHGERNARIQEVAEKVAILEAEAEIRKAVTPEEKADRDCISWWSMAESAFKNNMPDLAREYLQKIIDTYPEHPYAERAREKLK